MLTFLYQQMNSGKKWWIGGIVMAVDRRNTLILRVRALDNYILHLELGNGSVLELDMNNRLDTIRFCPLVDQDVFTSVKTDGRKLIFREVLEITLEEAMMLAVLPPHN